MLAVAVVAAERPIQRLVAGADLAVGMLGMVGADDAQPALGVDARQDQALLVQPAQNAVLARVAQLERALRCRVSRGGRHTQRLAYLRQGELAAGVELDQPGLELTAAGL